MKRLLQRAAAALAVASVVVWAMRGAHRGWTQTLVPVKTTDPVTGIDGVSYRHEFVPGVDFLVACWGTAAVMAVASIFLRGPKKQAHSGK